jgi:hypothetical protein
MAASAAQQDITLITFIPAELMSPSKIVLFPNRLYDTRFTTPTLKALLSMGMCRGICCTQAHSGLVPISTPFQPAFQNGFHMVLP